MHYSTALVLCCFLSHQSFSLYTKGRVLGFKRGKRNQRVHTSLLQLERVQTAADAEFYLGKRVAYVYRVKRTTKTKDDEKAATKSANKYRAIWGRITRAHGNSGVVKAKFAKNLPPRCFGANVRVVCLLSSLSLIPTQMLYPSRV